jgi:hypothetical protein
VKYASLLAVAAVVVAAAARARAGEGVIFNVPAGWATDAAEAKARSAESYASDTSNDPPAELTFLKLPVAMPIDDAAVRGFIKGIKNRSPGSTEVRHDYLEIAGVRSARVIVDETIDGTELRHGYYLMPAGAQTACLLFTSSRAGFDGRQAGFDAIAKTTRGLQAPARKAERDATSPEALLGEATGFVVVLPVGLLALRALRRRGLVA